MKRTQFLDDAEDFARRHSRALPFRYLQWLTGGDAADAYRLACKVYCDALPESSDGRETPLVSAARSFVHPWAYAATKKWLWRPRAGVVSDLETITRPYFDKWFTRIFAALKEPKRLTPRVMDGFAEFDLAEPLGRTVTAGTLIKLFVAPLWIPWLLLVPPPAVRPRFLRAYRKALSFFAVHDGHFARYPTRDFVTFADESNHPSRYLAFKRRCAGRLLVIQNGARETHPVHAFGAVDVYFVFGEFARRVCSELRMKFERIEVTGALCLNEWHALAGELESARTPRAYDVLMVDQSVWPHNGIDPAAGRCLLKIAENLGRYKARRPSCRIAYQLRPYFSEAEKEAVLATVRPLLGEGISILDNARKGDSYRAMFASGLVLTFSSTLGIESFFFGEGKKALFVNYTGSPVQDFAPEPRFQLTDPDGGYEAFERKLDEMLRAEPEAIPASVRDHQPYFDGKVEERIAAAIAENQR